MANPCFAIKILCLKYSPLGEEPAFKMLRSTKRRRWDRLPLASTATTTNANKTRFFGAYDCTFNAKGGIRLIDEEKFILVAPIPSRSALTSAWSSVVLITAMMTFCADGPPRRFVPGLLS